MVGAAVLVAIPVVLLAPMQVPPGQPLDATVVDTSAFPTVVFDLVIPAAFAAVEITPSMVTVDGVAVESVAPVDPTTTAVAVVVDDRPTIDEAVVNAAQGGAVELVRNTGEGTQISVATPSGLQSAFTADRGAIIARVAGITAGAPDVVPLPELIADAADALADSPRPDRHLVLVLGGAVELEPDALAELTAVAAGAGIRVHVVPAAGVEPGALGEVAVATGGVVPATAETVAAIDQVTRSIAERYRATATLDRPGGHEVALAVDASRVVGAIDVAEPAPPAAVPVTSETTSEATTPASSASSATAPAASDEPAETTAPSTAAGAPVTTAAASGAADGDGGSPVLLIVGVLVLVAAVIGAILLFLRRRRAERPAPSTPTVVEPVAEPVVEPVAEPVVEPVDASTEPEPAPPLPDPQEPQAAPEPEAAPLTAVSPPPAPPPPPPPAALPEPTLEPEPWQEVVPATVKARRAAAPSPEPATVDETSRPPVPEPGAEPIPVMDDEEYDDAPPTAPEPERPPVGARSARRRASTPPSRRRPRPPAGSETAPPLEPEAASEPVVADAAPEVDVDGTPTSGRRVRPLARPRTRDPQAPAEPPRRAIKPLLRPRAGAAEPVAEVPVADGGEPDSWISTGRLRMRPATGEVYAGQRRVELDQSELRVLELLMTEGGKGLTTESIIGAAGLDPMYADSDAADAMIAQVRRKTGLRGRKQTVRKERVVVYYFEDSDDDDLD